MNGSISGATSITASANIKASDFTGAYISDNAVNYFVGNVEDGLGSGKSGLLLYAYGSKGIYLYTNSEQRMVVNASGNVGIGTTAPAYTLDVAGSIRATSGFTGNLTGNASSATKLQTARTISLTGDVTGSVSFDGTKDVSITATVANDSHTHSWENITGKPSTFTPSPHTHDYLSGWSDTRGTAETPNSYNEVFEAKGIKQSSTYGISSGNYVQVFGYRGWHDSSGGRAHEFALADNGRIYHRDGSTTSWDSWDTVAYLSDLDGYATEDWVNSQGFLKNDTNTTYTLSQSGNTIFLNGSDGSESSVSISQSVSTTYTLTKSGSNIILRGSDGSESSVVDSNTTYDLSAYATINWVSNNFDSVSISRDQTSGVRIAVINVSGTSYSLYAPTAGEVSLTWDSISGKPSCYTPCDHGHHFDDITFNNTGTNRQYLAGDGRFYTISYNEISGTPAQYSLPILSNSTLGGAKVNLKHTSSCTFESSHTSTSTSVSVNSRTTVSGRYYAVEADSNGYLFVNVPWEAGESGGGITSINDAAGSSTATGYLITDASGSTVYRRALKKEDITNVLGDDYDTKNTAGSTNSTSKLFLIGAPEQSANPVTYSESGCYISGGQLYSDSELVATQPWVQSWVEDNLSIDFSMSSTNATNLSLTINGTTKNITNLYADTVDGYDISVVSTTPSTMLVNTIYFVY